MQIDWANFTAIESTFGGVLIGLAAVLLMAFNGRIMGVSGIASGALKGGEGRHWRIGFLVGTIIGPVLYTLFFGTVEMVMVASLPMLAVAGLLVGIGVAWLWLHIWSWYLRHFTVFGALYWRHVTFVATGMVTVFVIGLF